MVDPLSLLERADKHYLGCGDDFIFAPRFPHWLAQPGYWDEIDVYHYQLAPLFTVTFLDPGSAEQPPSTPHSAAPPPRDAPRSLAAPREEHRPAAALRPLTLRQSDRRWTPAELVTRYDLSSGLQGWEHRSVLQGGEFRSEWRLRSAGAERSLLAVVWTVQEAEGLILASVRAEPGRVAFTRELLDRHGQALSVRVILQAPADPVAGCAHLSERASRDPRWELTPFAETWRNGPVSALRLDGPSRGGAVYLAAACRVAVPAAGETTLNLGARVRPEGIGGPRVTGSLAGDIAVRAPAPTHAGGRAATTGRSRSAEGAGLEPGAASRAAWRAYFESVPQLSCSDPYFERYWYYRWYGLRLCGHEGGVGHHVYPGCCEGTGYFHVPIAYSAQCHARELRWLRDPKRARGVILNFLAHQKESGQLHGRVYVNHLEGTDFYFTDWGEAALAVDAVHPDVAFLRAVHRPLARYAEWLSRERDRDGTGLIDVIDHFETGQEYMSRYMAVSPEADRETWENRIRLKGVDATVYAYRLQRALAKIAGRLNEFEDAARWTTAADRTGAAIMNLMWDERTRFFSDVDPRSMERTGVKAAICFYPYFTDLVGPQQVEGLKRHLLDHSEFWTEYPVPSTSADDPYYSPNAEWKGRRRSCPWNGRVWPMANSHVAEAIARAAIEHDTALREVAAEFLRRFIRMMFHEGDPARPNCHEHYSPETGEPSLYRGFDDYQHSWVNDLIVKYVAGFRPDRDGAFVVDPFLFGLDSLRLTHLPYRGSLIDIELQGESVEVKVDGKLRARSCIGDPQRLVL